MESRLTGGSTVTPGWPTMLPEYVELSVLQWLGFVLLDCVISLASRK